MLFSIPRKNWKISAFLRYDIVYFICCYVSYFIIFNWAYFFNEQMLNKNNNNKNLFEV